MNRFFRKFILHKYSEQISAIGKRPVFIIADDNKTAKTISTELNGHLNIQINKNEAPFLTQIGSLAYAQFVGTEADYCQTHSKFKGDKLEESLRKISFKNTFGNNYGFEINPFGKSGAKKLKGNLDTFRWGAIINPDGQAYAGLNSLFKNMKAIYLFDGGEKDEKNSFLFQQNNCLCIDTDEFAADKTKTLQKVFSFLEV